MVVGTRMGVVGVREWHSRAGHAGAVHVTGVCDSAISRDPRWTPATSWFAHAPPATGSPKRQVQPRPRPGLLRTLSQQAIKNPDFSTPHVARDVNEGTAIHETPPKRGACCRPIIGEPPRRLFILGLPPIRRRSSRPQGDAMRSNPVYQTNCTGSERGEPTVSVSFM